MAKCSGDCACNLVIDEVERAFSNGATFDHCFERLSDAFRCSGLGTCRKRLMVSERASVLMIKLMRG